MIRSFVRIIPGLELLPRHLAGVFPASTKGSPAALIIIAAPFSSKAPAAESKYTINTQRVTKNLELWNVSGQDQAARRAPPRLAILLGWMLARKRHLTKYGEFYFQQGFDVLCCQISPMELLFPKKGSIMAAADILNFLRDREHYQNVVTHGFSVGCYLYGECLVHIRDHPEKYGHLLARLRGQIFDSAVDYYGIPKGLPPAMTDNPALRKAIELGIRAHMKIFTDTSIKHYIRSADTVRNLNPNKSPTLFLFSKADTIGTVETNMELIRLYEQRGIQVFGKCWENSPHVMHFQRHRDDYLEELSNFLDRLGLLNVPHRRAVAVNGAKL